MRIDKYRIFATRSIGRNFLMGLVPVICMISFLTGWTNMAMSGRREYRVLELQAHEVADNLARIVSYSIYESNTREITMIVNEYGRGPNVVFISVYDASQNTLYNVGVEERNSNIIVQRPIRLFDRDFGSIEVIYSTKDVSRQRRELILYSVLTTASTIVAVGIATFLLLEVFLGKPFSVMIDGVKAISQGQYQHRLPSLKDRCLDMIIQSVNNMSASIGDRESSVNKAKERFENLVDLLPETVYEIDRKGYFTFLNKSGLVLFGYSEDDLRNGLRIADLFDSSDKTRISRNLRRVLDGKKIGPSDYHARKKNGESFQIFVHFAPITDRSVVKGIRGIAIDMTEQITVKNELLGYRDKLRSLSNELVLAEERERRRIASELHDGIGHALTSISLKVGLLRDGVADKDGIIDEITEMVSQSARDVQSLIFDISPPVLYDIGIVAAVDWLVEKTSREYGLKMSFQYNSKLNDINESLKVLMFRAISELLMNVIKHAHATSVQVTILKKRRSVTVIVDDDGVGVWKDSGHGKRQKGGFGLFSIRERLSYIGGRLYVKRAKAGGTRAVLLIPHV